MGRLGQHLVGIAADQMLVGQDIAAAALMDQGAPSFSASRASKMPGSTSYSTLIRALACWTCSQVSAATRATASPR